MSQVYHSHRLPYGGWDGAVKAKRSSARRSIYHQQGTYELQKLDREGLKLQPGNILSCRLLYLRLQVIQVLRNMSA